MPKFYKITLSTLFDPPPRVYPLFQNELEPLLHVNIFTKGIGTKTNKGNGRTKKLQSLRGQFLFQQSMGHI